MLQANGCNAIGLTGADGNVICARRRPPVDINGEMVDYGFVGDMKPEGVNTAFLNSLLGQGIVPVLCAINHDSQGNLLNTNADTIASSVAIALGEGTRLIYCFEKDGVLADKDDDSSVIPHISKDEFTRLKAEGVIADGMIPKLQNAFKAIEAGIDSVVIKHARNILNETGTILK